MAGIKEQENIDELRKRLYDRGVTENSFTRHELTRTPVEVSRGWGGVSVSHLNEVTAQPAAVSASADVKVSEESVLATPVSMSEVSPVVSGQSKRRYRLVIILVSLVLFVVAAIVSSGYLFFGANLISANNISVSLVAPIAASGGEPLDLQIGITNQNSVPVRSALLVVNYPAGTRAADGSGRELYEERVPVADIPAGGVITVPLRAVLNGEENEEKEISASFQYRVDGSSGIFEKTASSHKINISTSPIVVRVSGVEKTSSGQEVTLTLDIKSNASTPQRNLLVALSYPNSFNFLSAEPAPAYSNTSWLINELPAQGSVKIILRGSVQGTVDEEATIFVRVGNPQLSNQFMMGAVLAQSKFGYTLEKPFTGVRVSINRDTDGEAVIAPGEAAEVEVVVENTLDQPIYDLRVDLKPTGNLIRDNLLEIKNGFYDASEKTIRFDPSGDSSLAVIKAGEQRRFNFSVKADKQQQTASFAVAVDVYARRVDQPNVAEAVIGTGRAEAKYSSQAVLENQLGHVTGPVPPVAGESTIYKVTLVATAGVNALTAAQITTKLPQYVSWRDEYKGEGKVEFNAVTKEILWLAGDISAGQVKNLDFEVALLPSVTQIGKTAVVTSVQELRATDRFTGVALRATAPELSTELSTELGFDKENGVVQASGR